MIPLTADNCFFSSLSPKDLFSWMKTSRDHRERVNAYLRRASNIENFLCKYFSSSQVAHFRLLQSRTQMIISGSTALQFFERVQYPDSDLDIYVEHDHKEEIVAWLLQIGYVFEPRRNMSLREEMASAVTTPLDGYLGMVNVYNFYKNKPERKIQLITSYRSPLHIILRYHSTCVMNVITHEQAYAFYPKATFIDHRSLKYSCLDVDRSEVHNKYADRGWTMIDRLNKCELETSNSEFTVGARHVGDSFCWTIDLLPKMNLPEAHIEINSWELNCQWDLSMSVWHLSKEKLCFSYLIADYETYNFIGLSLYPEPPGQHDAKILELLRTRRRISQ
ncbi:hypothetical protein CPB83DRAFT_878066 [Crepidotus variabilis]|uniref:Uncharacterized protein n=1 Tax=Crepidotus variabilis TaxID=179855 RepID=A0A9P6E606_9AGAR|nr:hypothetical protein CPB83DRAFT_878066 [Crepidotus variabilis]